MNNLKESSYLLCGSALPAMSLSAEAQAQLGRAIETSDFEQYNLVRSQIWDEVVAQCDQGGARALPVRFYSASGAWRQIPLKPSLENGEPCRIFEALDALLAPEQGRGAAAEVVPAEGVPAEGVPAEGVAAVKGAAEGLAAEGLAEEGVAAEGGAAEAVGAEAVGAEGGGAKRGMRALVQGIELPLSTPLLWLWHACCHPDGWLYVTLIEQRAPR